jgi:hypothetical protein
MKKLLTTIFCLLFLCVAAGYVVTAEQSKLHYVCNCQDNCKCDFVAEKPGKCKCGSELAAMHLLAIEKSNGIFCRCGKDCTCELSKDNPGKCGCGKTVKTAGIKGKYVCSCGADCKCLTLSDKPGKCHCGKDLKQVV